jgi:fatty acid desaturase
MDHKAFLAGLPAERRQSLQTRSNRAGLVHLLGHWGLIGLVGSLIYMRVPFWPLLLPIQGVLIIFTFTILHECTHKTPFRSLWLNETVGWISGFMVGLPFLWFRYFHMAHHKYTNDPDHDPELVGQKKPINWRDYLWQISGIPVWAAQMAGLLRIAAGRDKSGFIPTSKQRVVHFESALIVILYVLIVLYSLTFSTSPLILWIIPVIFGQPLLRLYLMAEHGRCPPVTNMLENSRTVVTNRIIRFLAWNMPYHVEHHTAPNVPFYRLPALHKDIKAHIRFLDQGYHKFHIEHVKQFEGKREVPK